MKKIVIFFNKQNNWAIKIGFVSLVVSIIILILGLILIATANFIAPSSYKGDLIAGNGFVVINWHGISKFLTSTGYSEMKHYYYSNGFIHYPLIQVSLGIIFALILWSIFMIFSILSLICGYIKRWLYS